MNTQPVSNMTVAKELGVETRQIAALLLVGHRLYKQGRIQDAAKIFEGLAVLDSKNPYVQGILGSIYQKQNQYEIALVRYNNVLAVIPDDASSLTNRGEILLKLGRFREAAENLKRAIELDPQKKDPAANRARLLIGVVQDAMELAKEKGIAALEETAG